MEACIHPSLEYMAHHTGALAGVADGVRSSPATLARQPLAAGAGVRELERELDPCGVDVCNRIRAW